MTTPPTTFSLIERLVRQFGPEAVYDQLSPQEITRLTYLWDAWARPSQCPPPGEWTAWLVMAGRGFGKNRLASEWLKKRIISGEARRIALLGRTPADVREVMVGGLLGVGNGGSGILDVWPPSQRPKYEPSVRRVTFHNGAVATTYSSENPEQCRGPQHDTVLVDELGTFKSSEAFDNIQMGLRLGDPKQVITTTPRPVRAIRDLIKDPNTVVTGGTTYENRANLAPAFFSQIIRRYEGTRRGQQELEGKLLEDVPGALWQRNLIRYRAAPELVRIIVGVDPSVGDSETTAECGILVVGQGIDGNYYVLEDATLRASPNDWARRVVAAYYQNQAHRIVAEENQGGKMVESTIRTVDANVPYRGVWASDGKDARAEPVAALYEQGRVFHVKPFEDLEDQLCVAGGALVETIEGPKPIEDIRAGESVLTRKGWRRVIWAGPTSTRPILYLETENGYNLGVTANHPIATPNGFVEAGQLTPGDQIICLHQSPALSWNMPESDTSLRTTAITAAAAAGGDACSTGKCGAMPTGRFPRTTLSIISTTTRATMPWTTCNSCRSRSIALPIHGKPTRRSCPKCDERNGPARLPGPSPASSAASHLSHVAPGPNIAQGVAEARLTIRPRTAPETIKAIKVGPAVPVYDLTVEDAHEFVANGVVVHNCTWVKSETESPDRLDALVWAMTELALRGTWDPRIL